MYTGTPPDEIHFLGYNNLGSQRALATFDMVRHRLLPWYCSFLLHLLWRGTDWNYNTIAVSYHSHYLWFSADAFYNGQWCPPQITALVLQFLLYLLWRWTAYNTIVSYHIIFSRCLSTMGNGVPTEYRPGSAVPNIHAMALNWLELWYNCSLLP